ncbi:hypothetical protein PTKIN_Ptkin07bG0047600 [Pterospermum kingtungense]
MVLFSAQFNVTRLGDPVQAEMKGIWFGLSLAVERGFNHVVIETDSLVAVSILKEGENSLWLGGALLADIFDLTRFCIDCKFVHVKRNDHTLAHRIAHWSGSPDRSLFWKGGIPVGV